MTPTSGPTAWDERYAEAAATAGSVWSVEPNSEVAAILTGAEPGTAVDLGCGEGRNALWLASEGWTVTAVDYSAVGLATGCRRAGEAGLTVEWVHSDVTVWPVPDGTDLVLLAYLQLPAGELVPLLRHAAAALSPGGRLVVVGHDRDNLTRGVGGPQDPALLHTLADLRAGAEHLSIERCERVERAVAGAGRNAIDAVLVARR